MYVCIYFYIYIYISVAACRAIVSFYSATVQVDCLKICSKSDSRAPCALISHKYRIRR